MDMVIEEMEGRNRKMSTIVEIIMFLFTVKVFFTNPANAHTMIAKMMAPTKITHERIILTKMG